MSSISNLRSGNALFSETRWSRTPCGPTTGIRRIVVLVVRREDLVEDVEVVGVRLVEVPLEETAVLGFGHCIPLGRRHGSRGATTRATRSVDPTSDSAAEQLVAG
jgi:hypothetical protein